MALVQTRPEGTTTVVHIDRPPANAIDLELITQLGDVAETLEADQPAAVVLTGREGYFSAGLDLKAVPAMDAAGQAEMVVQINRAMAVLYRLTCPVVSAITGHAIAGGLIVALCGDLRVCSTHGKLGLTEVKAGIPFPAVAMGIVKAELSPRAARLLSLRSDLYDPPEALALGIVDELAPAAEVLDRALAIARELSALPADTYARVKRQLRGEVIDRLNCVVAERADPMLDAWIAP